ncbi:MAG: hypothetical protein HY236_10035, partial [Acidobacteria bacterium]|nr:hypothetical protein [Acidobacteriota bacterium]
GRSSSSFTAPPPIGTITSTNDSGSGTFFRLNFNGLSGATGFNNFSFGSCYVYLFTGNNTKLPQVTTTPLDAGPVLNVTGPNGAKQLAKQMKGSYYSQLGGGTPGLPGGQPLFLDPGSYTVENGAGGTDVGAFKASLIIPAHLVWTNEDSINDISRSQDLPITWSGGNPSGFVIITGVSITSSPAVGGVFVCTEHVSAGRFTVPSLVLSTLPASNSGQSGVPGGFLLVGSSTAFQSGRFQASGLDFGYITAGDSSEKSVNFQ